MSTPIATPAESAALPATRRVTVLELLLVLGLPTSLFFAGSLRWLAHNTGNPYVSDARVASTLVFELALAALLLPFLRRRGWRPGQVAGTPEPRDVLRGAGVWLAAMASYYLTWIVFTLSAPTLARAIHHGPTPGVHVSAVMIVVVAVLNPLFEEFLWLGYGIPALGSRLGLRGASVVSVALRVAVHIYQGAQGIIGILPVAIVFTRYYARTRRIWPVVVAHVIADALAFALVSMR